MRPSTILFHLARHLLYTSSATRARSRSCTCSASSSASRASGSTAAISSARAAPIRRSSSTRSSPTGGRAHQGRDHRDARRRAAGQGDPRPLQPDGLDRLRQLHHLEGRPAGRPTRDRCHVNWVVCDSDWEAEFCRVAEAHPRVLAYVKNQSLGLEVPYLTGSTPRRYLPDFIVRVDDGRREPLNLSSRSRAIAARTPRRRPTRCAPIGCRASTTSAASAAGRSPSSPTVYEIESEFDRVDRELCAADRLNSAGWRGTACRRLSDVDERASADIDRTRQPLRRRSVAADRGASSERSRALESTSARDARRGTSRPPNSRA